MKIKATSIAIALLTCTLFSSVALAGDIQRMSKEKLQSILDDDEVTIVDVRTGSSYKHSSQKIPGAIRLHPSYVADQIHLIPKGGTVVLYCA